MTKKKDKAIYKTLHRNITIEESEPYLNPVVNSAAPEP